MADGEGDETELEQQLELQLEEQRDSLNALKEALASDPSNSELLSVQEELILAIRDSEEGLLHLKRSRLLRETDSMLSVQNCGLNGNDVKVETLDPTGDVEVEPLEAEGFSVGRRCRFRHIDGRWYNGQIVSMDGSDSAKIAFLTPTSESMVICKFFLQQRCRFGSNCRMSHGVDVPLSSLKAYIPTIWQQSFVGCNIWALPDSNSGVWKEAELESFDDINNLAKVVFRNDGSSTTLGIQALSASEYAEKSDDEEDESSSEQFDSSDDEDVAPQGLGFLEASNSQRGIQTDTVVFANWEHHTRGIASKMMANMGYREGMGLGASGQGRVDPISVKALRPNQSLDHVVQSHEREEAEGERKKKRSRGGRRKRDKKFADAARAAKQEEESRPDVFSFINNQLAAQVQANNGTSSKKRQNKGGIDEGKKEGRRALVAYDDEVKDLRLQIEKLEEMVSRNRKDKVIYEAFTRKLNDTRKALADAKAAHASASHALVSKEKEKKWLKF